jgi:hypothetical protein
MALGPPRDNARARLKLTTALYYLPNGKSPHKAPDADTWGVEPDWAVKLTPREVRKNLERERESNVIHNERKDEGVPVDESAVKEQLESLKVSSTADSDEEKEDEMLLTEQQIKDLDACPFDMPNRDAQLETAVLQLRLKLAGDLPWPRQLAKGPSAQPASP